VSHELLVDFQTREKMSRGRTFSDSQDYDDELAELHDKRERELRLLSYVESANEDTDDASEDGAGPPPPRDEHQDIKEQYGQCLKINLLLTREIYYCCVGGITVHLCNISRLYHDKLGLLKANLEELEGGNHTEFNRELSRLEIKFRRREQVVGARWAIETEVIEREYTNERLLIVREFEEKKIELRESLIAELEEKRKGVEAERTSLELLSESSEVKPMNTRKLRRRPNEPAAPIPEKRRKAPNSQITLLLDDRTIDDDLKTLAKKKIPDALFKRKFQQSIIRKKLIIPIIIHFYVSPIHIFKRGSLT